MFIKKNGFSLIELLIVVFIIATLTGIVGFNFSQIRNGLALNRASHQLTQDIRRAQEMAMSAAKLNESENCSILVPAKGYGVYINVQACSAPGDCTGQSSNTSYVLYADTAGDASEGYGNYTSADCIVKTINMEEQGIYIKEIKNTTTNQKVSINFSPPNPNTTIKWLEDDKNEVEIVLALESNASETKTIAINRIGLIEIK